MVISRGLPHQSSTVKEHTSIVSVQIHDAEGRYLGSAHIDRNGVVTPNRRWEENLKKKKKK
jgi:hypothetical protein